MRSKQVHIFSFVHSKVNKHNNNLCVDVHIPKIPRNVHMHDMHMCIYSEKVAFNKGKS